MEKIKIGGIETFSIVDFPDKIAAVVFMQGCPWRCPFCYNADLQEIGKQTDADWSKFIAFLTRRKGVLDAVVFSGGEPLVQDGLYSAIEEVRALGYKIGLHTGGYRPKALEKVLPLLDWVGFDIKAPFVKYSKAVGVPIDTASIEQSLDLVLQSGVDFENRTTCDPRLLEVEDIRTIATYLKNKGVKKYFLQKYRPIKGDNTSDEQCEKFFQDAELIKFLQESFSVFSIRK